MLQQIREHTQGWISGVIITVMIVAIGIWGIHSYFEGNGNTNVVATVNGQEISRAVVDSVYERARDQSGRVLNVQEDKLLKQAALQNVISTTALEQDAKKSGFIVEESYVTQYMQQMPEFQIDGKFSLEKFQMLLANARLTTGGFLSMMRSSMLIEQPKLGIILSAIENKKAIENDIALINQERQFRYFIVEVPSNFSIGESEIKSYYDSHHSEFMTPEKMQIEYIQVNAKDIMLKETIPDQKLQEYYRENINSYKESKKYKFELLEFPLSVDKALLDKTVATMQQSKDLAAVAKQTGAKYSHQNALISFQDLPVDLQKGFEKITDVGVIDKPITTEKNIVIAKINGIKQAEIKPFAAVKDEISKYYAKKKAEDALATTRDKLADLVYEQPDSLKFASETLKLPVLQSETFTRTAGGKDISKHARIRDVAFSADILQSRNNSDVITLDSETLIVLRVKDYHPAELRPLAEVTPIIKNSLVEIANNNKKKEFAASLSKSLNTETTAQSISQKYKWQDAGFVSRIEKKYPQALINKVFQMHENAGKPSFDFVAADGQVYLISLTAIKPGNNNDKNNEIAHQLQLAEGLLEYQLYSQSLVEASKVVINQR